MDSKLIQMQKDWLDKHPNRQAAWMIIYYHYDHSPETDGYRFYAGRDLFKLSSATDDKGELIALYGFPSVQEAMDVCRGCRQSFWYVKQLLAKRST